MELMPGGVVLWHYKPGSVVGFSEAQGEVAALKRLLEADGRVVCCLLINISEIGSIDRASRQFFASDELHSDYGVRGLALVMGSPIGTMIGNIYHAINKTRHPTRLFTSEEKAHAWLKQVIELG
jgi:hypothetical protein